MLNSAKELLHQMPVEVHFAGFKSDTYSLGQAGWDLSLNQQLSPSSARMGVQLAMRHGDRENALYALSHHVEVPYEAIMRGRMGFEGMVQFFRSIFFNIMHVAPGFRFQVMPIRGSFSANFSAFDPTPQQIVEEDIRDFKFFKTGTTEMKDLIVSPEQVPELLDVILKIQGKGQNDIRARARSRENFQAYQSGEMFETKPARTVQAQIITLAG